MDNSIFNHSNLNQLSVKPQTSKHSKDYNRSRLNSYVLAQDRHKDVAELIPSGESGLLNVFIFTNVPIKLGEL